MSSERSVTIYGSWLSAVQQFDYFMTGLALAMVGYIGANLDGSSLRLNGEGTIVVAGLLLLGSAAAGLQRIELGIEILLLNYRKLDALERSKQVAGRDSRVAGNLRAFAGHASKQLEKLADRSKIYYRVRNILLLSGFGLLLIARVTA